MSGMTDMDGWMRDVADAAASLDKRGEGWSGWATQYRGKMPKLWGAREIAELNYYPGEGARLIFLQEVAAPSPDAEREVGHVG